jgi:hypothetical protein
MKAINGLDYIRDNNHKPKEFASLKAIIRYAYKVMPELEKKSGFSVATFIGDDYVRFSYGRKC